MNILTSNAHFCQLVVKKSYKIEVTEPGYNPLRVDN